MGYTNVRDYEGGKQDWIEAGLAVEGESPQAAAPTQERTAPESAEEGAAQPSEAESAPTNASTNPQKDVV